MNYQYAVDIDDEEFAKQIYSKYPVKSLIKLAEKEFGIKINHNEFDRYNYQSNKFTHEKNYNDIFGFISKEEKNNTISLSLSFDIAEYQGSDAVLAGKYLGVGGEIYSSISSKVLTVASSISISIETTNENEIMKYLIGGKYNKIFNDDEGHPNKGIPPINYHNGKERACPKIS